jgi:phosphoglycolate phosphatase-like HAD superfamily hydrolase
VSTVRSSPLAPSSAIADAIGRNAVVFWDFDGVIKESVEVKGQAFETLFRSYGPSVASKVLAHHQAHGGVSRFEKLPVYLNWAGVPATPEMVSEFCERFSALVRDAIVAAPWVPGVREYLDQHYTRQAFILVTATPQDEIVDIVAALGLGNYFRSIVGSPTSKPAAVAAALERERVAPEACVYVGDSTTDLDAAAMNGVPFVLRRTPFNVDLQARHCGLAFDDFA